MQTNQAVLGGLATPRGILHSLEADSRDVHGSLCSQAVPSSSQTLTRHKNGTSLGRDMSLTIEVRKRERKLGLP